MISIVERVKSAMLATGLDVTMWDDAPLTELAFAAIAGMRVPTDKMIGATEGALHYERSDRFCLSDPFIEAKWRAMIDAALREKRDG